MTQLAADEAARVTRKRPRATRQPAEWALMAASILGPLVAWEFFPRAGLAGTGFLPPLSEVLRELVRMFLEGGIFLHVAVTSAEILTAFLIATPLAVGLGFFLGLNPYWRAVAEPLVSYFVGVPKSVFLPLFILAVGIGFRQKVLFGVFQAFFVITITMVSGMRDLPASLITYGKSQRASPLQMFWHIYRPAVTPVVVEGLRLGMIFAVTGVTLAEMYASRDGLGQLIASAGRSYNLSRMLAVVLIVALISVAINESLRLYERRVGRWREGSEA